MVDLNGGETAPISFLGHGTLSSFIGPNCPNSADGSHESRRKVTASSSISDDSGRRATASRAGKVQLPLADYPEQRLFVSRYDWPYFEIIQLFLCHSFRHRARNDLKSDMEFRQSISQLF